MDIKKIRQKKNTMSFAKKIVYFFNGYCPVKMTKILYYINFQRKLDLKNPQLYSEKLQYLKLFVYPENKLVCMAADKAGLHKYLKNKKLEFLSVPLIGIYDNTKDICWESLPNSFVIKKSNGSQTNIIIQNKNISDKNIIIDQVDEWMKINFGRKFAEFHYDNYPSKIVIEEFLENITEDWKIFYANGQEAMIQVNKWIDKDQDNYVGHKDTVRLWTNILGEIIDIDLDPKVNFTNYKVGDKIELPIDFQTMIISGRLIAKDFPFVRIDFFNSNKNLYLGELTFTPGSGFEPMSDDIEKLLGEKINLNL